ncbi:hypothetical protein K449DRAFT_439765 [Hypoxylon sp. EC38]|nr:hypothetical protein K449DRAFT_439765 [Hypoxylon sp. EC38]
MKSLELTRFESANHTRPAVRMGAVVETSKAYTLASSHGMVVVGGMCPTVEVVTGNGTLIASNSTHLSDLFWALRGGGGGAYGVVVSMTVKNFRDTYTSSAHLTIPNNTTNTESLYEFIGFVMALAFVAGLHKRELDTLMQQAFETVSDLHLDFEYTSSESPAFLSAFSSLPMMWNVSDYNAGGRLIPRDLVTMNNNTEGLVKAIRHVGSHTLFSAVSFNVRDEASSPDEVAVYPSSHEALFNTFIGVPTS